MRVHLIKKQTVENFGIGNTGSRKPLTLWLNAIRFADWEEPNDIKHTFGSICKYLFGEKQVHLFVCWLGTHAEYDKLCNEKQQYIINVY